MSGRHASKAKIPFPSGPIVIATSGGTAPSSSGPTMMTTAVRTSRPCYSLGSGNGTESLSTRTR